MLSRKVCTIRLCLDFSREVGASWRLLQNVKGFCKDFCEKISTSIVDGVVRNLNSKLLEKIICACVRSEALKNILKKKQVAEEFLNYIYKKEFLGHTYKKKHEDRSHQRFIFVLIGGNLKMYIDAYYLPGDSQAIANVLASYNILDAVIVAISASLVNKELQFGSLKIKYDPILFDEEPSKDIRNWIAKYPKRILHIEDVLESAKFVAANFFYIADEYVLIYPKESQKILVSFTVTSGTPGTRKTLYDKHLGFIIAYGFQQI